MFTIEEIAEEIRKNNLSNEQIYRKFGGFSLYIPKVKPNYQEDILREYNGYNHYSLATKYNISINTVYRIVRENKKKWYYFNCK